MITLSCWAVTQQKAWVLSEATLFTSLPRQSKGTGNFLIHQTVVRILGCSTSHHSSEKQ